jgi:hypothetical protein
MRATLAVCLLTACAGDGFAPSALQPLVGTYDLRSAHVEAPQTVYATADGDTLTIRSGTLELSRRPDEITRSTYQFSFDVRWVEKGEPLFVTIGAFGVWSRVGSLIRFQPVRNAFTGFEARPAFTGAIVEDGLRVPMNLVPSNASAPKVVYEFVRP